MTASPAEPTASVAGEPEAELFSFAEAMKVLDPEERMKIGAGLRSIATAIERNNLRAGSPYAVAVVILTDDKPTAWCCGVRSNDDLHALRRVVISIDDAYHQYPKEGEKRKTLETVVQEREARHQAVQKIHADKRAAERAAVPWACEHCGRRYKTERGAVLHENVHCLKNPANPRFGDDGDLVPLWDKERQKIVGYQRKTLQRKTVLRA